VTQNPLAFRSFAFVDVNGYQWSVYKSTVGPSSPIVVEAENSAPYSEGARKFQTSPEADPTEIKAAVRIVALGWKSSGGKPKPKPKPSGGKKKPDDEEPGGGGAGGGFPWWLLLVVGYVLTRKGR